MSQRNSVSYELGGLSQNQPEMASYKKRMDPTVERLGKEFSRIETVLSDKESHADSKYYGFLKRQRDKQSPRQKSEKSETDEEERRNRRLKAL